MLNYFKELANIYNVPLNTVLSIALNRYGVICDREEDNRKRFNVKFNGETLPTFFAICINTYDKSPFTLKGTNLYLDDEIIGVLSDIEKDTCTATYFRNDKKVITFNSNSRSKCSGCKFCGTYSLTEDDTIDFSTIEKISDYFKKLISDNGIARMDKIENITICTGCFENEDSLIKHLLDVYTATHKIGFNGSINYIGSQLRTFDKIKMINEEIPNFGMYLTLEKFTEREKYMRKEKSSLTLEKAKELLTYSSSLGITTTFLYILGLEDLEIVEKYMKFFKESINKFPIVQIFQNYTSSQEMYRCEEGKEIEYYLKTRKLIDEIFKDTELSPKNWECFRSLYYDKKTKIKRLER